MEYLKYLNVLNTNVIYALILGLVGLPIVWFFSYFVGKWVKRYNEHISFIVGKLLFYIGILLIAISMLNQLGFNVAALLGAAGVVGVAVGFAAKTTLSNMISGAFLIIERPFSLGDKISCQGIIGYVSSIDLLSTKIKTLDGKSARIPNETIVQNTVINASFYKLRRHIFTIYAKMDEFEKVNSVLTDATNAVSIAKKDPKPIFYITNVFSSSVNAEYWVWSTVKEATPMQDEFLKEVLKRKQEQSLTFDVMTKE